jgi:hypothetical protein
MQQIDRMSWPGVTGLTPPSWPGLTRPSAADVDGRVKPGHDGGNDVRVSA